MKPLVIFYSYDGNTKFIAETIAQTVGADLLQLKPVGEKRWWGPLKYLFGGRQATLKLTPTLEPYKLNPNDYELIFIGTPVWAWNYTPAINSFLTNTKLTNKKIALFCSCGGQPGSTLEKITEHLAGNEILNTIVFKEPLKYNKEEQLAKAKQWALKIIKA